MCDRVHAFDEDGVLESAPVPRFGRMALGRASVLFENGRLEVHPGPLGGEFMAESALVCVPDELWRRDAQDQNFACMSQTRCYNLHTALNAIASGLVSHKFARRYSRGDEKWVKVYMCITSTTQT